MPQSLRPILSFVQTFFVVDDYLFRPYGGFPMIPLYISGSTKKSDIDSSELMQAILPHVPIKERGDIEERYSYIRLTSLFKKYLVKKGVWGFRMWYLNLTPYQATSILKEAVNDVALTHLNSFVRNQQELVSKRLEQTPLSNAAQRMLVRLATFVQMNELYPIAGLKKFDILVSEYKEDARKEDDAQLAKMSKKGRCDGTKQS